MAPEPQPQRRSFLAFLIFGLGAIFNAILGVPIVCYILDPRHRKSPKSAMKLVEGVKLDDLQLNAPVQGVIRDTRVDGWTLYPSDVIGRVWVVLKQPVPWAAAADVAAFNEKKQADKDAFLLVFTTICPHLGCSVNLGGPAFLCPCHSATFLFDGSQAVPATNPAKRGMDTLEWELDAADPKNIKVKYERFEALTATKTPTG
jgi:Rieske Fe-S protein